jgi:hypothetical protein
MVAGDIVFQCFRCFKVMFQVSHLDFVKVDLRCCICCNQYMHVASLCFKCFRYMFQVFYLDVAYVAMVLYVCSKRMFQVFQMF